MQDSIEKYTGGKYIGLRGFLQPLRTLFLVNSPSPLREKVIQGFKSYLLLLVSNCANTSFNCFVTRINVVRFDNSFKRCAPT